MLLLYLMVLLNSFCLSCIYIPLCFYFIRLALSYALFSLHIYIPLCFYFIAYVRLVQLVSRHIYIPLCFYFIVVTHSPHNATNVFTFHYASTLSVAWHAGARPTHHLHSTMLLLYRQQDISTAIAKAYLHSTMLLLYLSAIMHQCKFSK